ncbi:MAG: L,D-transpeptidase [Armatimonadota bacterium]|nr:L,D-transpeptidase [bacterium]
MKTALVLLYLIGSAEFTGFAQEISLAGPNRSAMIEGHIYPITWKSDGLQSVNILVYGTLTPLGNEPRGDFEIVVGEGVPASDGEVGWITPWLDCVEFNVKIMGYDNSGHAEAFDERVYGFRPASMANRIADGIYLDLHKRADQRLYVQRDHRIVRAYISSSSRNYLWLPAAMHPSIPHDHAGVFRVLEKIPDYHSRQFDVPMPYAMRYLRGHFIHATSPGLYDYLGEPASSGCNRLTLRDARELYYSTPIGTRVEVIGPNS